MAFIDKEFNGLRIYQDKSPMALAALILIKDKELTF